MGRYKKVCERIYLVGGDELSDPSDCLVYAIDLGELVLIDCGTGQSWRGISDNLLSAGLRPDRLHTLVLTHGHVDHIGAAAQIKEETGCKLVAHAGDLMAIESGDPVFTVANLYGVELRGVDVDRVVECEQENLRFSSGELKLVHIPGHTPGSLAVVYQGQSGRVLFGQDMHGPFSPAFGSDIQAWRQSMQRLLELNADILCEGHFGLFRPASVVRKFIQHQLGSMKTMMPKPVPL